MEPLLSLRDDTPSELTSHYDRGYAATIQPVPTTRQQHQSITFRKNSKVRLNDQLIPKPTDINIGENLLTTPLPKQHPYLSHVSRFALFPSFRSPDDPHTGVRATSQPFLQPHIPNSAPEVTVLSKTIGGSHRYEILESPMKTKRKAVMWPEGHGFLNPLKERQHVFYPTPPKAVLPNANLRDWELSLSERTSNMLKNLERSLWVTSYQMHHTGSGPANPLKMDDFKEKMSGLAGMNSHSAPLRERSYPVFVPSKPVQECRRRTESKRRVTVQPLNPSPGIIVKHTEQPDVNSKGHNQSGNRTGSTEAEDTDRPHEILHKRQNKPSTPVYENRERGRYNDPGTGSHAKLMSKADLELEKLGHKDISNGISILPRPQGLPGVHLLDRAGTMGREGAALNLLDLQNSFSRSEAHRNFNSSVMRPAVNLRDNVVTGKKHNFYGINCYYLHG